MSVTRTILALLLILAALGTVSLQAMPFCPKDFVLLAKPRLQATLENPKLSQLERLVVIRARARQEHLNADEKKLPFAEQNKLLDEKVPNWRDKLGPSVVEDLTSDAERNLVLAERGKDLLLTESERGLPEAQRNKLAAARAQEHLDTQHAAYTADFSNNRVREGRDIGIPADRLTAYMEEADAQQKEAFEAGAKRGDYIVLGNIEHMKDYDRQQAKSSAKVPNLFPNGAFQDMYGVNPSHMKAFQRTHDLWKELAQPGDPVANHAIDKLGGPIPLIEYAVGKHGNESLAEVARIVQRVAKKKGYSDDQAFNDFVRFADLNGGHNLGLDLSDDTPEVLMIKYPSLTLEEAKSLKEAWYHTKILKGGMVGPTSVNARLGQGPSDYDGPKRGVLSLLGIAEDRRNIIYNAKKVWGQNLGSMDFNPSTAEITVGDTTRGVIPQEKAAIDQLRKAILPGGYYVDAKGKPVPQSTTATFKLYRPEDDPDHQYFVDTAKHWLRGADRLKEDNTPAARRAAGLKDIEEKGKIKYERAMLYKAYKPDEDGKMYEYLVRGDYTREGFGPKKYKLQAQRREIGKDGKPIGGWADVSLREARNPGDLLTDIMIEHGDMPKPLSSEPLPR